MTAQITLMIDNKTKCLKVALNHRNKQKIELK